MLQGYINLEHLGRRGYHIPKLGTIQVVSEMNFDFQMTFKPFPLPIIRVSVVQSALTMLDLKVKVH